MTPRNICLAILLACCTACAQNDTTDPATSQPATEMDRPSYALGHSFGTNILRSFQGMESELDIDAIVQGVRDAMAGNTALTEVELDSAMLVLQTRLREADMARRAALVEEKAAQLEANRAAGIAFLAENGAREGVITTESGLQYEVRRMGEGPMPEPTNRVRVHYKGTLIDGTVFDSSYDRDEPLEIGVSQVVPGWVEALQLMPVGSHFRLVIPSELGYGERAVGDTITPGSVLVFEVEMLEILR